MTTRRDTKRQVARTHARHRRQRQRAHPARGYLESTRSRRNTGNGTHPTLHESSKLSSPSRPPLLARAAILPLQTGASLFLIRALQMSPPDLPPSPCPQTRPPRPTHCSSPSPSPANICANPSAASSLAGTNTSNAVFSPFLICSARPFAPALPRPADQPFPRDIASGERSRSISRSASLRPVSR